MCPFGTALHVEGWPYFDLAAGRACGRYPQAGHRHAALYEGPVYQANGTLAGIILVDQCNPHATPWNPRPAPRDLIKRRTVNRQGRMHSDGSFPLVSDNAEAFYVIER